MAAVDLLEAVELGNLRRVKEILSELTNAFDRSLFAAKDYEITLELLSNGANPNATKNSETPLQCAIKESKGFEVCKLLLMFGAFVNTVDKSGETALSLALKKPHLDIDLLALLLLRGGDIQPSDKIGLFHELTSCEDQTKFANLLTKIHLLKGRATNIYEHIMKHLSDENQANLHVYRRQCGEEIDKMKNENHDGISLYDVVSEHTSCRMIISATLIEDQNVSDKYPIYGRYILHKKASYSLFYKQLNDVEIYTYHTNGKKVVLDLKSVLSVVKYLKVEYLENLITAFYKRESSFFRHYGDVCKHMHEEETAKAVTGDDAACTSKSAFRPALTMSSLLKIKSPFRPIAPAGTTEFITASPSVEQAISTATPPEIQTMSHPSRQATFTNIQLLLERPEFTLKKRRRSPSSNESHAKKEKKPDETK